MIQSFYSLCRHLLVKCILASKHCNVNIIISLLIQFSALWCDDQIVFSLVSDELGLLTSRSELNEDESEELPKEQASSTLTTLTVLFSGWLPGWPSWVTRTSFRHTCWVKRCELLTQALSRERRWWINFHRNPLCVLYSRNLKGWIGQRPFRDSASVLYINLLRWTWHGNMLHFFLRSNRQRF